MNLTKKGKLHTTNCKQIERLVGRRRMKVDYFERSRDLEE